MSRRNSEVSATVSVRTERCAPDKPSPQRRNKGKVPTQAVSGLTWYTDQSTQHMQAAPYESHHQLSSATFLNWTPKEPRIWGEKIISVGKTVFVPKTTFYPSGN